MSVHDSTVAIYSVFVWRCEPAECVGEGDEWGGEAGALGPGGPIAKVVQLFHQSSQQQKVLFIWRKLVLKGEDGT